MEKLTPYMFAYHHGNGLVGRGSPSPQRRTAILTLINIGASSEIEQRIDSLFGNHELSEFNEVQRRRAYSKGR